MSVRIVVGSLAVSFALVAASGATAKDFEPGDVRVCNSTACVPVLDPVATEALAKLVYTGPQPAPTARARLGSRFYELRFTNGYVFGIVAGSRLDRFLSYGVVLERFRRGSWYRVPPAAATELRRLARTLAPLRLTRAAVRRSR